MSRLLVVEDEPGIAFALETDLRSEGYDVDVVTTGDEASRRARSESFDLVLLDVMLPGKDGFEVCREIRRAGVRTPIILLTAKSQEAEKVMGLELGADDYVTKPFSPRELRARIKAALRRAAPESPDVFRFEDTEVDFARCEVRRGDTPIELSALEFKLLSVFVRSRGRVLTREQLLALYMGVTASDQDIEVVSVDLTTGKQTAPSVRPIQRFTGSNQQPTWSPDGRSLAYVSVRGDEFIVAIRSMAQAKSRNYTRSRG